MGTRVSIIVRNKNADNNVILYANTTEFDIEKAVRKIASESYGETDFVRGILNYVGGEDEKHNKFIISLSPRSDVDFILRVTASDYKEKGLEVERFNTIHT